MTTSKRPTKVALWKVSRPYWYYLFLILGTMDSFSDTYSRPDVLLLQGRIADSTKVKQ
jgi:hypothetical protein